jgi:hypothetical protein
MRLFKYLSVWVDALMRRAAKRKCEKRGHDWVDGGSLHPQPRIWKECSRFGCLARSSIAPAHVTWQGEHSFMLSPALPEGMIVEEATVCPTHQRPAYLWGGRRCDICSRDADGNGVDDLRESPRALDMPTLFPVEEKGWQMVGAPRWKGNTKKLVRAYLKQWHEERIAQRPRCGTGALG